MTKLTSILRATEKDFMSIVNIGRNSVAEAHKGSCPPEDLEHYVANNYNETAIKEELRDENNSYHILYYDSNAVGFSKIILNAAHDNVRLKNAAKLDRIYLLKEFQNLKLGYELLKNNLEFAKNKHQCAIWLYTWVGNSRAINFYEKVGFKIIGSHKFYVTETSSNLNHQMILDII